MTNQGAIMADLVLRVLAGPNAGAEVRLAPGDWLVGTGAEADILLAEPALAPAHLRLSVAEAGVQATALAPGVGVQGRPLEPGGAVPIEDRTPIQIGGTVLAFGPAGTGWSLREAPAEAGAPETSSGEAPTAPKADLPLGKAAPPQAEAAAEAKPRRRWLGAAILALTAIGLGTAGGLALLHVLQPPPPPELRSDPAEAQRRVMGHLRASNLQEAVEVTRRGEEVQMRGILRDEEQLRAAQAAQRQGGSLVEARLLTEAQLLEQARIVLRALGLDIRVEQPRPGHLVLSGFAPDQPRADDALRRVRSDVPLVRSVEDAMVTPERARTFLDRRLQEGGLAGLLAVAQQGNAFTVSGTLGPAGAARWQEAEAEFRERFAPALRLEARIGATQLPAPRGVRLGAQAAIVMEDGGRFTVGDAWAGGGRITAIEADRMRVRGPGGEVELPYAQRPAWVIQEGATGSGTAGGR